MSIMSWIPPYFIDRAIEMMSDFEEWSNLPTPQLIDQIGLQFWGPSENGSATLVQHEMLSLHPADVERSADFCRQRQIAPLLCVYNYDGHWNWEIARNAFVRNRDRFVDTLLAEMERYNLAGIDLDFEGTGDLSADRDSFARLVEKLSKELRPRGKLLTVDLFHNPSLHAPNLSWLADWVDLVDSVQTMGYDQLYAGAETPYTYADQQRICMELGLPPEKLLMGLPGWLSKWGSGGRGEHLYDHLNELLDLPHPTGVCVWDAAFIGEAWRTPETVWLLNQIKQRVA